MGYHLHWMGNEYYTIPQFIDEARQHGVSRRISGKQLAKMDYGDIVFIASRGDGVQKPVVFGYFCVLTIQGMDIDWNLIPDHLTQHVREVNEVVQRGCGTIVRRAAYLATTRDVRRNDTFREALKGKNAALNGDLVVFPRPYPMLKNLKPFRGFRPFDGERFLSDLQTTVDNGSYKGRPKLSSLYYA